MAGVGSGQPNGEKSLGIVAITVAVGLIVIYLVFVSLQWRNTDAGNAAWSRHQELLTGLEALAFTAVGVLLGTTVQRQVTKKAEERVVRAETEVERSARDAEKGRALQRTIEAKLASEPVQDDDALRGARPTGPAAPESTLTDLAALARLYDETD